MDGGGWSAGLGRGKNPHLKKGQIGAITTCNQITALAKERAKCYT